MKRLSVAYLSISILFALVLSGCAGRNFVRPDPASLTLGSTTQDQINQTMGTPFRTGEVLKNGKTLKTSAYAFASYGEDPLYEGVTPARSQGFYFLDDVLVGTEFSSSFKADGTDFDAAKVAQIEKGKTTKAEIEMLFGPAGGNYVYPLTPSQQERASVYLYSQTKGSAFNLRFYVKTLVVSYNEAGVVTNVDYSAQGKPD